MKGQAAALFLCCLVCTVPLLDCWTFDDVESLTTAMMTSYNEKLRPFISDSAPTTINMGLWLASIVDLDEINQKLVVSAYLYMDWKDQELQWNPSTYNGTLYFAYPQKYLWIPDITIVNSVESMEELGFDRNTMYVSADGTVQWTTGGIYSTSCDIDVTFYPFDTQTCDVIFSTLVTHSYEIDLAAHSSSSVDLSFYSESGTWELVEVTTTASVDTSGRAREAFSIKLRRLRTFYILSIIIPVIFLAFTVTLVFLLPNESGEKMGLSMTVLLAYAVYLTLLSDHMPQTSLHISILSLYLNMVLGLSAAGVVLSVVIINLYARDDEEEQPSPRLVRMAVRMQHLMRWRKTTPVDTLRSPTDDVNGTAPTATNYRQKTLDISRPPTSFDLKPTAFKKRPVTSFGHSGESPEGPEGMKWKEVALTFDRFAFYVSSITLAATTVVFFLILIIGSAIMS